MSGYTPCGCRDCFEVALGEDGALCWKCREAGCEGGEHGCSVEPEPEEPDPATERDERLARQEEAYDRQLQEWKDERHE